MPARPRCLSADCEYQVEDSADKLKDNLPGGDGQLEHGGSGPRGVSRARALIARVGTGAAFVRKPPDIAFRRGTPHRKKRGGPEAQTLTAFLPMRVEMHTTAAATPTNISTIQRNDPHPPYCACLNRPGFDGGSNL